MGRLLLWDESDNAAACHKYGLATELVRRAVDGGYRVVSAGSCGSLGVALSIAARTNSISSMICVPEGYQGCRTHVDEMERHGAVVVRAGRTYEDAVAHSTELARANGWLDCNPSGRLGHHMVDVMASRITSHVANAGCELSCLWVPVGNGTTLAGALKAAAQSPRRFRVVGVTSAGNNSILASAGEGRHRSIDPRLLSESWMNEPLCNWFALHGKVAMSLFSADTEIVGVDDSSLLQAASDLHEVTGVPYTPSGAAAYAAALAAGDLSGTHALLMTARAFRRGGEAGCGRAAARAPEMIHVR